MMKKSLWLVAFLAFFQPKRTFATSLEITVSEPHGTYSFLRALGGDSKRSKRFKELFEKSPYAKKAASAEWIDRVNGLDQNFQQWENFFETQAILARDVRDFNSRTTGILPMADQEKLGRAMDYFTPIYREIIAKPNREKIKIYAAALERLAKTKSYASLIDKIPSFYGYDGSHGEKFVVGLVPLPGKGTAAFARSLGATEAVEAPIDAEDHAGTLGVIAHELAHSYSTVGAWGKAFRELDDPMAAPAYRNLEEALATAIGNGYAYRILRGKQDLSSWYNDPLINDYAHSLYPLVAGYLDANKTIDDGFVKKAVLAFKEKAAAYANSYDNYLGTVVLSSSWPDRFELSRPLRKYVSMRSIDHAQPLESASLSKMRADTWMGSTVFVVRRGADDTAFKSAALRIPILEKAAADITLADEPSLWEGMDGKQAVFVFRVKDTTELEGLLQRLIEKKTTQLKDRLERVF